MCQRERDICRQHTTVAYCATNQRRLQAITGLLVEHLGELARLVADILSFASGFVSS